VQVILEKTASGLMTSYDQFPTLMPQQPSEEKVFFCCCKAYPTNEAFMKKAIFIGLTLFLLGSNVSARGQQDAVAHTSPSDAVDIQHVMDAFHHAVTTHDGKGVSELFLNHGSTWVTVLSDKSYTAARAKKSSTQKVSVGSYQDFSKFISTTKSELDPRHSDVRISSDGAVASVYFHFSFVIDGKVENRGDETWQLVKTGAGWRIVAITYSSNPGAV
jgi:hypothetical protein